MIEIYIGLMVMGIIIISGLISAVRGIAGVVGSTHRYNNPTITEDCNGHGGCSGGAPAVGYRSREWREMQRAAQSEQEGFAMLSRLRRAGDAPIDEQQPVDWEAPYKAWAEKTKTKVEHGRNN